MKLEWYADINQFLDGTMDVLMENEVQNNIILGNSLKMKEGVDSSGFLMTAVKDDAGGIRLIAWMTPPFNLCLYETGNSPDDAALEFLINELAAGNIDIPGVITEKSLAARFSNTYRAKTGKRVAGIADLRLYRLDKVEDVPVSSGSLRLAGENDLYYLPYWSSAFTSDCGVNTLNITNALYKVKGFLDTRTQYVWEDTVPVSMAAVGRRTNNCAVVVYVYTPPFFREKGYASSCVAELSRQLLENGFSCCSLFTELSNPVSNSIYMKIGYKPVCDFDEYRFEIVI